MRTLQRHARIAQVRWLSSLILALVLLLAPAAGAVGVALAIHAQSPQHLTSSYEPGSQCSGSVMPC